jgi:hypothetical protein
MEQCPILVIPVMVHCAGRAVGIRTVSFFFAGAIISIHNLIAVRIIMGYMVDAQSIISRAQFCNSASHHIIFVVIERVPPSSSRFGIPLPISTHHDD